jgi:hypothetical protein
MTTMNRLRPVPPALLLAGSIRLQTDASAADRSPAAKISVNDFAALQRLIKPQRGEAKWAEVPWLTNLQEACRRALAEDKPLLTGAAIPVPEYADNQRA